MAEPTPDPMPHSEERFVELMKVLFATYYIPLIERRIAVEVERQLEARCSPISAAAPGAPSSTSSPLDQIQGCIETTCLKCGAALTVPVPKPVMLRASLPYADGAGQALKELSLGLDEALSELERLGGDAPHRAVPIVSRMKALFWMVAREVATRAYQGAWNQATDGGPVPEHHMKAFTRSVLDGQVPRHWEPKL
jgi:hypothetical protein